VEEGVSAEGCPSLQKFVARSLGTPHSLGSLLSCSAQEVDVAGSELGLGVVGGSDQRPRLHLEKPDRLGIASELLEFLWGVVAFDWDMTVRGREILAEIEPAGADGIDISDRFSQLFDLFAEAEDQGTLHPCSAEPIHRTSEKREGVFVDRSWSSGGIETPYRLDIVSENRGVCPADCVEGPLRIGAKVGDENFGGCFGSDRPQFFDDFIELSSSPVGKIVSIDGSDHHMLKPHFLRSLRQFARLVGIDGRGNPFRDGAESALSRADLSENQEGGSPCCVALVDVGAVRFLANGVE